MILRLFAKRPPLDEPSVQWLMEVFAWALRHLDAEVFDRDTRLVTPTNEHYPGRVNSVHGMVELIFRQTAAYAGLGHWPFRLVEAGTVALPEPGRIALPARLRQAGATQDPAIASGPKIPVGYDPAMINNPEAMIAGFAQVLAHHLGSAVRAPVPGGIENWPQATEVLGVFLGFGLMFANTASSFPARSCGGCGGPPVQRHAYLSEDDINYALAIFCRLKGIPEREALRHLKTSLRPHFKRCLRDLEGRETALAELRAAA
jgi:hypothetical protein